MVLPPPALHQSNDADEYESEQNNDMRFFGTPMTLPNRNTIKDTEFIAAVAGTNVVQLRQRRTVTSTTPSTAFGVPTKVATVSEPVNQSLTDRQTTHRDGENRFAADASASNNNVCTTQHDLTLSCSQNPSPTDGTCRAQSTENPNDRISAPIMGKSTSTSTPPRHQLPNHVTRFQHTNSSTPEKSRLGSSNDSVTSTRSVSIIDASFTSDSYSLLSSMQFISRDLEEEERANKSKSDRERAFLYKKRYMDVYGLAVGLTRRVTELEKGRLEQLKEIQHLKETIQTPGPCSSDHKIQTLCREVKVLARQLSERDEYLDQLHGEEDESVRALNDLKLSQQTAGTPGATRDEEMVALRARVERLEREKERALNEVDRLNAAMTLMQHKLEKESHTNQQLQESIQRTEQELEAVHTQWLKEKSDWIDTVDQYKKQMSSDAETWKREVGRWKQHERQLREQLEQANNCITSLQTQAENKVVTLQASHAQVAVLSKQIEQMQQELVDAAVDNQTMRHELFTRTQELHHVHQQANERSLALEHRLYQAELVRRRLHNQVMELKGNIRVFCRVRPMLTHESVHQTTEIFQFPDYRSDRRHIELLAGPKSHVGYGQNNGTASQNGNGGSMSNSLKKYAFDFDLVFNGSCTQSHVFEEVSALVQSALDGYNVCIFAYGQTGSGKTYTMMHGMTGAAREDNNSNHPTMESDMGIVGRAMTHIFNTIHDLEASGWSFTVSLEMMEIYNESLRDLLAPTESMEKVDLRLDSDGKPMVINSCVHVIENEAMACKLLEKALARRATKTTQMNDRSSRSHCVISFRLLGMNGLTEEERKSVVHLIDLAGSERLSKSGSGQDKEMLKEAQCINKSLSALGNVIAAIAKKSSHVPYRDSKLTHFLRPSLGGDAKTLMICNLSPLSQHREETLNSLRFAKTVNSCEIAYPSYK